MWSPPMSPQGSRFESTPGANIKTAPWRYESWKLESRSNSRAELRLHARPKEKTWLDAARGAINDVPIGNKMTGLLTTS